MSSDKLSLVAKKLCETPKGILAADESTNTIKKRFNSINVESNFEMRRNYRELLFKTPNLNKFISGVILYDETIRQSDSNNLPLAEYLSINGIIPGIKVDIGAIPLEKNSPEKLTEGLDGLEKRLEEYKSLGAIFTKWRAIISINTKENFPSNYCIESNSFNLARYAKIVQDCEMVPIVEPEVIMDGDHSIEDCYEVTTKTLKNVFKQLELHKVFLEGILLKPNMVISGTLNEKQASVDKVADLTLECLQECVPKEVPGIVFLSGGQSNELATEHLNKMNKKGKDLPWNLSFSYGRALQQPSLSNWLGKEDNIALAQEALYNRSRFNSDATLGNYDSKNEK
jgi:fructose-bisphosphate aldolase class I